MKNASDLQTFPVSSGLLEPHHVQAIDPSSPLWVYLWLLNRVTRDDANGEQFDGIVLHGRPVSIRQIADELGIGYRACRRHLSRLVDAGYVLQKKTGAGMCTYTVTKSKRWAWKRRLPTDQKVASNPQATFRSQAPDPQATFWPQGSDPQATFGIPTDQKVACAERGTRARSHKPQRSTPITKNLSHHEAVEIPQAPVVEKAKTESDLTDQVLRIASEHPRLEHLKGRPLSRIQEEAIAQAIVRDGFDCVLKGTRILRDAVARWPHEERRYAPNPERFFQKFEYLKKASDWERSNNASAKPSVAQQRQERARAVLTAAITDRIGPDVGSSGRDDGPRTDGARERALDGQARLRAAAGD